MGKPGLTRKVENDMKQRILFVGHSDTRITPLCAAIMKYLCLNKGLEGFEFFSGGFWAMEGQSVNPALLTSAGEIGIDLEDYKAHYVTAQDIESATLIIPQDDMVSRGVSSFLGNDKEKLYRPMRVYDPTENSVYPFRRSREECMAFCEKLFKKLASMEKEKNKIISAIEYRSVKKEEAAMVFSLEELCFSHPWTVANIESEIEKETSIFLGAFYENQMVGYASCYLVEHTGFMNNVGVHPSYRQLGIGQSLMQHLEEAAIEQTTYVLTLEVRSKNAAAIGMYQKLGYKQQGVRRFFYRDPIDDGIIMTKVIAQLPENDGFIFRENKEVK